MRALQELVSRYDALVFSDEIHSPLVLGGRDFVSYARMGAEFASHTITATAATKGWNIAGLPNAQVIIPDEGLRERWDCICQEKLPHSMSTIGALGSIEAYTNGDEWQREIFEVIEGNIRTVSEALASTKIDFHPPQATYLTWWGFEAYPQFGDSPASVLLERAHIAVNAGITLGADYSKWARMNLACPPKVAEEMLSRVLGVL
ncbi:MAG: aminotransferase class I/II-fold pyridoxal phosphate-dependent enzyme [Actinomyces sp.]|nr:aminotransferase class I/II-fold pyridoxal phosphate-dependent enzyme [Actinomyces sp.]